MSACGVQARKGLKQEPTYGNSFLVVLYFTLYNKMSLILKMLPQFEEAFGTAVKRASIIGCEQTFAQFKDVTLTKRRPSATSLALVGAAACGDTGLLLSCWACPHLLLRL